MPVKKTKHTLLDWLRVEYAIGKPTNKLQNLTAIDSDNFVAEVKHIRGKKLPLTAAGLQALREEYTPTSEPLLTPGIATHYSLYTGGPAPRR
ncbi:MAG: hypothetical protein WCO57_03410 [Verrucomicrobiota bacterium]